MPLHVNPNDPNDWTWLQTPLPILSRVIGGIITVPMASVALLLAFLKHASARRAWRNGELVEACVVHTRFAATAPFCQAVRVTPQDVRDKGIYTVFLPTSHPQLAGGEWIYILRPSLKSKFAVAAAWFDPAVTVIAEHDEQVEE
jgi:hypothetical protein